MKVLRLQFHQIKIHQTLRIGKSPHLNAAKFGYSLAINLVAITVITVITTPIASYIVTSSVVN